MSASHYIEKVNILTNPLLTDLDKAVLKSTKRSVKPLKMKHVQLIVSVTWHREAAIFDLFRQLDERLREHHWVVAFKALIITHIVTKEGNSERVLGYLTTQPTILNMAGFRDKSGTPLGHEQSKNVRAYAGYLEEKVAVFREMKKDPLKDKDLMIARMRTLPIEDGLLDEVAILQRQVQALVGCKFFLDEIDNVVTMQAFRLLLADMMILFGLLNEAVIRILENFFEMSKRDASKALAIYKQFASQTAKVVEFFDVAKKLQSALGVDIPVLKHAPVSLVNALEEYLNQPNFDDNLSAFKDKKSHSPTSFKSQNSSMVGGPSHAPDKRDVHPISTANAASFHANVPAAASKPTPAPAPEIDFFGSLENEAHVVSPQNGFGSNAMVVRNQPGSQALVPAGGAQNGLSSLNPFSGFDSIGSGSDFSTGSSAFTNTSAFTGTSNYTGASNFAGTSNYTGTSNFTGASGYTGSTNPYGGGSTNNAFAMSSNAPVPSFNAFAMSNTSNTQTSQLMASGQPPSSSGALVGYSKPGGEASFTQHTQSSNFASAFSSQSGYPPQSGFSSQSSQAQMSNHNPFASQGSAMTSLTMSSQFYAQSSAASSNNPFSSAPAGSSTFSQPFTSIAPFSSMLSGPGPSMSGYPGASGGGGPGAFGGYPNAGFQGPSASRGPAASPSFGTVPSSRASNPFQTGPPPSSAPFGMGGFAGPAMNNGTSAGFNNQAGSLL